MRYGYVNSPYGDRQDIEEHNLCLYDTGDFNRPPSEYEITFLTRGQEHHMKVAAIEPTCLLYVDADWNVMLYERFTEFSIDGVKGWGVTEYLYRSVC